MRERTNHLNSFFCACALLLLAHAQNEKTFWHDAGSNPRPLGRLKCREIDALTNSATTAGYQSQSLKIDQKYFYFNQKHSKMVERDQKSDQVQHFQWIWLFSIF